VADPECPYFGKCGGCSSQHIHYDLQLENKKKQLASCIGIDITNNPDAIKVFSAEPYHYRNRMDFIFHKNGIGLREKGNWKSVVDIEQCPISNDRLNQLIKELREHFYTGQGNHGMDTFDVRRNIGTFRYAVIRTPNDNSSISFVLNEDSSGTGDAIDKIKHYAKSSTAENIIITYVPKNTDSSISEEFFTVKGSDMLHEDYLDKIFYYSVQGFFQNNTAMAEKMHEYVRSLIKSSSIDLSEYSLLDLYAGVGTFGINNSSTFKKTFIVESDKHCIAAARLNIEKNKIKDADIIELDAMQLKKVELPEKLFVITDPPRSGMHPKTMEQLKKLKPKTIIYISCNIQQLGKDLDKFKEYEIKSAAMFDLFPQTPHVEAIVHLERR